jgi:mRNA interferase RelE/StbE
MSSGDLRIAQTPLFGRKIKKFSRQEKNTLDEQVRLLRENPTIGKEKKGDLSGILVHKYKFNQQEMLLAYSFDASELLLITVGCHENYYRDLKSYLK